jgi:cobalt-precorrin 5A hydrolase
VLAGEKIGIRSSVALEELVDGLYYAEDTIDTPKAGTFGIVISDLADFKTPFETSCILVPRSIVAGIGCKKNTPEEQIEAAVLDCLQEEEIAEQALCAIASIDLKKQEEGILSFCKKRSLPFQTFLAEDLLAVSGSFTESEFVEKVTGVSNVCERSAVAAGGDLICRRRIYNGVTVALARKRSVLRF